MFHIVLPVHNRAEVSRCFFQQLLEQDEQNYCLWLVDDGCTDETILFAQKLIPSAQLKILRGDGSLWWGGSLQFAYEAIATAELTEQDFVLLINDDVFIEKDFLTKGEFVFRKMSSNSALQAVAKSPQGKDVFGVHWDFVRLRMSLEGEVNCLSTRGLLMSARTFLSSGGFRPRWLPHYLSDYEFTIRLGRQGVQLCTDKAWYLTSRPEFTGSEPASETSGNLVEFLTKIFSYRAKSNPLHWSAFCVLVCPWYVVPINIIKIWVSFLKQAGMIAVRNAFNFFKK